MTSYLLLLDEVYVKTIMQYQSRIFFVNYWALLLANIWATQCTFQHQALKTEKTTLEKFSYIFTKKLCLEKLIFWNEAWLHLLPKLFAPFETFLYYLEHSSSYLGQYPSPSSKNKTKSIFKKNFLLQAQKTKKICREKIALKSYFILKMKPGFSCYLNWGAKNFIKFLQKHLCWSLTQTPTPG